MKTLWFVLTTGLLIACGGDDGNCATAKLNGYSTQCTVDDDCAPVFAGDTCSMECLCPNAAVSKSDLGKYNAYLVTHSANSGSSCSCNAASAFCTNGTCKFSGTK